MAWRPGRAAHDKQAASHGQGGMPWRVRFSAQLGLLSVLSTWKFIVYNSEVQSGSRHVLNAR